MSASVPQRDLVKAAQCGEPSYVWRAGQERRLAMIVRSAGGRIAGRVLENGCGVGMYIPRLAAHGGQVTGLEYDYPRCAEALTRGERIVNAAGEALPFPAASFDLILSHEVLEHVQDDRRSAAEMARLLRPGGRAVIFTPNRGYPFETHGVTWRGRYRFGNIPLVNYLPRRWRDRLAPHVRVYSTRDMDRLFAGLPLRVVEKSILFGAYDNIIARWPRLGRGLRSLLQWLERTPLRTLGLSHYWVLEKLP
ncbi:MAG: class I SAM-dependent methyltransferase [Chloroflexi bacterium]|nr:class I SAM-dependent methyltransferase [Chloroflexota bacterium]